MKKGITNSATSKNQTTLGQFWSSNGSKPTKTTNKSDIIMQDDDDDDDIELLTAMEQFEKNNSQPPPPTTKPTTNTTTTSSTSKWPIAYKPDQNPNQTHRASVSAPANDDEQLHTYPDFDRQSGLIWIYPTNYEKRDYQYKVVSAALFQNTLVVLPTGLGKTFIAAVVMFNYCRWYPTGKIIFTAPTKPLVAQQMDACAKVMGIRKSEMCEMTGGVNPEERRRLWLEKRVFFLTPQTLNNDLVKSTCPWSKIRCLIIDEAHRALGQHAYCQVVQELCKNGEEFRILALSATPGNNVEAVQNVINNLKISHIEMFTDESPDIKKYSFDKIIDKIVVGPNQLMQELRRCILNILKPPVETLNRLGIFYQKNPEHISSGSVILTMRRVMKDKPQNLNDKQYQEAKGALFFAISFYHALDELEKHDKKNGLLHATFRNNSELNQIYTQLQNLFDLSQVSTQQRRTTSLQVAHPKLSKLRECVVEHFQTFERTKTKPTDQTRVIIFSEKRDSVREIAELLEQDQPLVKPMAFIGQASSHAAGQGINQKLQKKVVNDFRAGGYNVLIATSIGEEGLDIGSVDLIICFDALKSPIRLVQRMGRTGRARQGRIVLLMTEGKEERTYYEGEMQQKRIFKLIVDGARMLELYRNNLRMIPHDIQPVCQEMTVKINDDSDVSDKQTNKKFKSNDSDFNSMISKTKQQETLLKLFRKDKLLTDNEFYQWVRNYQLNDDDETPIMSPKDLIKSIIKTANEKWSNEQREIQSQSMSSSRTKIFVDFMNNYTNERVYVDIPDHTWQMDEPIVQEITIPSRSKMPSPFDRSKLKEQIQSKQTCSPIDLTKMPGECDELLNLQPIIHRNENKEEIDCGDLFGSTSKQACSPMHLTDMHREYDGMLNLQPIIHQQEEEEEIDCGDLFGSTSKQTLTPIHSSKMPEKFDHSLNVQSIIHQKVDEEEEDEEIDCGDLFGSSSKQTCTPVHSSRIPEKFNQSLNFQPIIHQKENEEEAEEEIDCGDLFGSASKQTFTANHSSKTPGKCDKSLNFQPIIHQKENEEEAEEEIDCGDLFGTGSTFDITCSHDEPMLPTTSSPTQTRPTQDEDIGNFNVTMDDLFAASQTSHLSPTLQITDIKSQQKNLFDDDDNGMNDDELLEAFNKHIESSSSVSNQITNPSPILILSNRVNTQIPKFDLEFTFDDLDNSDEVNNNNNNNIQPISISESTNKHNITTCSDNFETPIRPVPSKKRARRISTVTPDIIGRKKCKSAQELGNQEQRHLHRRLASEFFDDEAIVDDTLSDTISSDEEENDHNHEHDHFIDDRQVLTQMANIDMKSVYLKSIKSPKIQFRPLPLSIPIEDIYSQLPHMTMHDDTYDEDDSFVDDTTQIIDDHHGEVDFDELANILGTQSVIHRPSKVTRRGVKFGPKSETTTPRRKPTRRVQIAQSPL